jgi:neutral ceramidase
MSNVKIGFGASKITPGLGAFMAGYFHERQATAVHDDLFAKAMLFDDGKTIAGILSCDLICLTANEVAKVREIISKKAGIDGKNIMICCTHTHTGPQTRTFRMPEGAEVTLKWLDEFPEMASLAVIKAISDMETCTIEGGIAYEDRVAFNRRYKMKDGTTQTNPGYRNPDIIEPAGPIDPEVGVISFTDKNSKLKALYVNYACHCDCVGGTEISADYPGHTTVRLQERLNGKPFVLFTNGACGDVNHIDVRSQYPRQGHEHSRWMGETLASDVCIALKDMMPLSNDGVSVISKVIQLPMRDEANKELGVAEIQAIKVGDIGFVGIPAEYFVELQMDIKKRSPFKRTFVSELANGWVGYVPTKKAFEENMKDVPTETMKAFDHKGYEVRSALSRGFLPGVGEAMADTAVEILFNISMF